MGRFWEFLRNEQNRLVLSWLGGGLVVAATGAWAAFIYFYPLYKSSEPTSKADPPVITVQQPPEKTEPPKVEQPPGKADPPAAKAEQPPGKVEANCGSVALGGNVSGSTITVQGPTGSDCSTKPK